MGRLKKWQSGMADIVSTTIGMMILSIAVIGTSAAMIYGRDALIRTEHYKTVCYHLRGEMEKLQAEIQLDTAATNNRARRMASQLGSFPLDTRTDHSGRRNIVYCNISKDEVLPFRVYDYGPEEGLYYYKLGVKAVWREIDDEQDHTIAFKTSAFTRESRSVRN